MYNLLKAIHKNKKIPKHCLHKNIKQHNCSKSAYSAEESEDFAITGTKQFNFETLKQKTLILNDNNFIVLFYCIFDQIKAAQVSVREFCQKHFKSYRLFWMVGFLIFSSSCSNPCVIFFFQQTSTTTKNAKQDAHIETWCTNYQHFLVHFVSLTAHSHCSFLLYGKKQHQSFFLFHIYPTQNFPFWFNCPF